MTAKSTDAPALDVALKTLWGASRWPGMADGEVVLTHPSWQEAYRRLDQLAGVRASGVLYGPNGVGKSTLLHRWGERLSPKQYRFVRMAHGSLAHSDLLRHLVKLGGREHAALRADVACDLARTPRAHVLFGTLQHPCRGHRRSNARAQTNGNFALLPSADPFHLEKLSVWATRP